MTRPVTLTPQAEAVVEEILRHLQEPLDELVRDEIEAAWARTRKERR